MSLVLRVTATRENQNVSAPACAPWSVKGKGLIGGNRQALEVGNAIVRAERGSLKLTALCPFQDAASGRFCPAGDRAAAFFYLPIPAWHTPPMQ